MNALDETKKEQEEIRKANEQELKEIAEYLMDIRRRTGYGRIVIEMRAGEIIEYDVTVKRRPKIERIQPVI